MDIMADSGGPDRPILRWHGGKWKLAPWVISHFPAHRVYVEPFGGAASVLLRKQPAITEIWNDLEDEVVNLFRVLRNDAVALAELLALTPYARSEYHSLYGPCDDPIERARRFIARSYMGQSSKGALRKSGFDSRINPDSYLGRLGCLRAMPEAVMLVAERFVDVVIESRPAIDLIRLYDRPDALIYLDPPYLGEHAPHYTHEMTEADHVELLALCKSLRGMAVISGYPSEIYDDELGGWRRVERAAFADSAKARTEVLWINHAAAAALADGSRQSDMFAEVS